jgi:hypothetical protein
MATITTKYSVGDTVYYASTMVDRKRHPCPDCQGSKKWKAVSPAGTEYEFSCPRCSASFNSYRDLMLDYSAHVPLVSKLTIGSIQVNTAVGSYDAGNRYMCLETGVGSGSIYDEARLFLSEEEAHAAAAAQAADQNSTSEWIVKLYDKALKISDYELESAALKNAKDEKSKASFMLWNLGDLFEKIDEASDKDEILECIEDYKNFDWQRDKGKPFAEMATELGYTVSKVETGEEVA